MENAQGELPQKNADAVLPKQSAEAVPGPASPVAKQEISYDEFSKVELKVGTIISAEKVPGSDKLLKLSVDIGESSMRTLAAGIAQYYQPESLVGRQLIVVANLAPRSLRGVLSQGMLLAAETENGGAAILSPDSKVKNGSKVR